MITIIDYGLGNLASVGNALFNLKIPYKISCNIKDIKNAKILILPGVGAAGQGMKNLKDKKLDKLIIEKANTGTPILGICLGMQLMLTESEEGNVKCLGLIEGKVRKFKSKLKVPQIGWNQVRIKNQESSIKNYGKEISGPPGTPFIKGGRGDLFCDIPNNSYFYFVNSFYCDPEDKNVVAGVTDYDGDFCSMFIKGNIYGVQFHPEKSGEIGLQLLKNFYTNTGS